MNEQHVAVVRGQNSREINEFVQKILVQMGTTLDLSGAELRDLDLTNVDFRNANLNGTDFSGSTFDSVNFMSAKMRGAYFRSCKFINCIMDLMDARDAEFVEATISGCKIMRSNLNGADFMMAELKEVRLHENVLNGKSNFAGARFEKVSARKMKINGSRFAGCRVTDCYFGVIEFSNANLTNLRCEKSTFEDTLFVESSDLTRARLMNCRLQGVELREVNGRSSDFSSSYMKDAILIESDFYGANFSGCDLRDADLSGSKFNYGRFSSSVLKRIRLSKSTEFVESLFDDCQLSVSKLVKDSTAVRILARGVVQEASFVNLLFGRRVRDKAWIHQYEQDIKSLEPSSFWSLSGEAWRYAFRNSIRILWKYSSNYGRNISLWSGWSVFLCLCFATTYFFLGESQFSVNPEIVSGDLQGWFKHFYYSVVTFTTLGFGDITPRTSTAMFYVMLEVIMGYVMLGGLLAILANRLARRND